MSAKAKVLNVFNHAINLPLLFGVRVTDLEGCPSPMFVDAVTQNSYLSSLLRPEASYVIWKGGIF